MDEKKKSFANSLRGTYLKTDENADKKRAELLKKRKEKMEEIKKREQS